MLHVVLPVHNRQATTETFVRGLLAQTYADWRLVLVDDGSTDGTREALRTLVPAGQLRILVGDGQLWWAGSLQAAYTNLLAEQIAHTDAVLIINDDVRIQPDFLEQGMLALAEHPGACIQAIGADPSSGAVDRGAVADLRKLDFRPARGNETPNCLSTRGLIMGADTFVRSDGLRPRWLPHYLSDYEFTLRLRRQGVKLMVDERFRLEMDLTSTGLDSPMAGSVRELWRQSLSNRAKFNPLQWSAFAMMVCPWPAIPGQLARIWLRFARTLYRTATMGERTAA